jgi:hypothetical protein
LLKPLVQESRKKTRAEANQAKKTTTASRQCLRIRCWRRLVDSGPGVSCGGDVAMAVVSSSPDDRVRGTGLQ